MANSEVTSLKNTAGLQSQQVINDDATAHIHSPSVTLQVPSPSMNVHIPNGQGGGRRTGSYSGSMDDEIILASNKVAPDIPRSKSDAIEYHQSQV